MKKTSFVLLIICFCFSCLSHLESYDVDVEVRVAAFLPFSKKFRKLYDDVGPCYEIQATAELCGPYEIWVNGDWFYRDKNHDCGSSSTINIGNGSFGINYVFSTGCDWNIYVGIGPSFGGIFLDNHTPCCKDHVSKFVCGGVIKSGFNYIFCNGFIVDVFVDYLYQPVNFHKRVEIGGIKAGLGLGYQF